MKKTMEANQSRYKTIRTKVHEALKSYDKSLDNFSERADEADWDDWDEDDARYWGEARGYREALADFLVLLKDPELGLNMHYADNMDDYY